MSHSCPRSFGPGCLAHYFPHRCGQANPIVMVEQYRWGLEQRALFDRYAAIVVASGYMRAEYLRAGVAPEQVHVIPLFAPPHPQEIDSDLPRRIDVVFLGLVIVCLGVIGIKRGAWKRILPTGSSPRPDTPKGPLPTPWSPP